MASQILKYASVPALLVLLTGCFSYMPLASVPPPGTDVRVRLTVGGALRLSELDMTAEREYEGELVSVNERELLLSIARVTSPAGIGGSRVLQDHMAFLRDEIELVEERRVSVWRTSLLTAALATALGMLIQEAVSGGGGENAPPSTNPGTIGAAILPELGPMPCAIPEHHGSRRYYSLGTLVRRDLRVRIQPALLRPGFAV